MPPIKNQAHFRPEDFSGRMLAQAGERKMPSGLDAFFAEPKPSPKRPAPRSVKKTSPPAERPMPLPQAEPHPSQSLDFFYDEILTLGEVYGRIVEELRMERERRADLERVLAGHQEASETAIERLRREAGERERRTQRTVWGVVGGAAAAVAAAAGTAVYLVRSHARFRQEMIQQTGALAQAWRTSVEAAGRQVLVEFLRENRELVRWLEAGDQQSTLWEGWRKWLYTNSPPVLVRQIGENLNGAVQGVVDRARTALPQARAAATGGAAVTAGAAAGGWTAVRAGAVVAAKATSVVAAGVAMGAVIHYSGLGRYIGTDWVGEKIGDFAAKLIHGV